MEEVSQYMFRQDWWTFSNDSWSARDQVYEDSRIVSPDKWIGKRLVTVRLITLHFISKSVRRMLTAVQPLSWSTM